MLSERARGCGESPTLAISARAKALKKEGHDVVDFGAGQPDFEPPENIKQAILDALNKPGYGKYTAASGTPELKNAVVEKLKNENGIEYSEKQVIINCGAKHSLFNAFLAMVDSNDEVIIPSPYWVSYPEQVKLAGGKPVIVKTGEDFKLKADDFQRAITEKTKILVLNSPSNPTGAVIDDEELKGIADLAVEKKIYVISDEIYEKIIYGKKHTSIASLNEEIKSLTLTINGLSKSHAIPGLRMGYAAGPEEIIKAMGNIQAQSTSNPTSIIQEASLIAIRSLDHVSEWNVEFQKRRDYIVKTLNEMGMTCGTPDGAFYILPKLKGFDDSVKFTNELLEKEKVAVVPGVEFGKEGTIRISYATSMENIRKGMERIGRFLNEH